MLSASSSSIGPERDSTTGENQGPPRVHQLYEFYSSSSVAESSNGSAVDSDAGPGVAATGVNSAKFAHAGMLCLVVSAFFQLLGLCTVAGLRDKREYGREGISRFVQNDGP